MNECLSVEQGKRYLEDFFEKHSIKMPFVVCGKSWRSQELGAYLAKVAAKASYFSDFAPNPQYESAVKGAACFRESGGDCIIAAGGGSAIDVAKCIKLFSKMNPKYNYLEQEFAENKIPFLAIPTTAGTGSESTSFAVIYYKGEKKSLEDASLLPTEILLCPSILESLPDYQKKVTMMDALCHATESYWSINSTKESKKLAASAIEIILKYYKTYICGDALGAEQIMYAANLAGRAINITKTTAAHAMSYKLTSLYNIPHGHAVSLCLPQIWKHMLRHVDASVDPRGKDYLKHIFEELAGLYGGTSAEDGPAIFEHICMLFDIIPPELRSENELEVLVSSVNVQRLANNPVLLKEKELRELYMKILEGNEKERGEM